MRSFEFKGMSANDFVAKVTQALSGRAMGKIASVEKDGEDIVLRFSSLGKSELRFNLQNVENGFRAVLKSEKIALAHKFLKDEMESKFSKIIEKLGGRASS